MNVGAKGIGSFGFKTADNWLTCDSAGNCMLKDSLAVGPAWTHGTTEKPQGTKNMGSWVAAVHTPMQKARMNLLPNMADNALTCDSAGNCMLTDELAKDIWNDPSKNMSTGGWS